MRTRLSLIALIAAGALVGCGGPGAVESKVPETSESHGGVLVPLTDNQAYVELLNGKREMKNRVASTTVEAYVLQPDRKSPIAETPTSVEVKIKTSSGDQVIPLKAADAATAHFVSEPGPYELNQVGGEVTVTVGGKTLSGTFRGPR